MNDGGSARPICSSHSPTLYRFNPRLHNGKLTARPSGLNFRRSDLEDMQRLASSRRFTKQCCRRGNYQPPASHDYTCGIQSSLDVPDHFAETKRCTCIFNRNGVNALILRDREGKIVLKWNLPWSWDWSVASEGIEEPACHALSQEVVTQVSTEAKALPL